jgi:hypothetical protein
VAVAVLLAARGAHGEEAPSVDEAPPLGARADEMTIEARTQKIELRGDVRAEDPPFYLSSERLILQRSWRGVEVEGKGRVAFCPCLGTPLAVAFDSATVAPPGDLFLREPRLEFYDVPVFWLPWFWLRSPGRVGVLPPDLAYRGADGFFAGDGVHVPLTRDDTQHGLDLRGGAYFEGGAAAEAALVTPGSATVVKWDHLRGDGVLIDARGASGGAAWDVDAIRGARGVASTSELDAAARRYDRASAEAAVLDGGWSAATGVRAVAVRGGGALEFGAAGPMASVRRSGALGEVGAYDATIDGGALRGEALRALSFGRADAGAYLATRFGPLGASLTTRMDGDVADDGTHAGADGAAAVRAELALPLARAYDLGRPEDPVIHRFEPRVAAAALSVRDGGVLGAAAGRGAGGVRGNAAVSEVELYNAVGRWASRGGSELLVAAGAIGTDDSPRLAVRWHGATASTWVGSFTDVGRVFPWNGAGGVAAIDRFRLGRIDDLHLSASLAVREGIDPVVARLLTDAPLEPSSGFLSQDGWTGGARLAVPWTSALTTSVGADGDLSVWELVAARTSLELRDRCGCLAVRATAAHRLGREGVDVWFAIDLAPDRARRW